VNRDDGWEHWWGSWRVLLVVALAVIAVGLFGGYAAAATIDGTGGDDTIYGTSGPDVINALAGWDWVDADGGGDYVYGNGGQDELHGGNGSDYMEGGSGDDQMFGEGTGYNILHGNGDDDILKAQNGFTTDTLNGGTGSNDVCYGDWSNFPSGPHDNVVNCDVAFWRYIP
jgi:RTX calcium-binding nonapeptide repeat (4 copies)